MIIVAIRIDNQAVYESLPYDNAEIKQIRTETILADATRDGVEVEIIEMTSDEELEQYILVNTQ